MSAHKKKAAETTENLGIVVGDGKHHNRFFKTPSRTGAIFGSVTLALIAIVLGVILLVRHHSQNNAIVTANTDKHAVSLTTDQIAQKQAYQGNTSAAEQTYLNQIAATKNKQDQAVIYTQLASLEATVNDNAKALTYTQKADSLNPTAPNAKALADAEVAVGDIPAAKKDVQEAISRVDKSKPGYGFKLQEYQEMLKGLGS